MKNEKILTSAFKFFFIVVSILLLAFCSTSPRTVAGRTVIADLDPIETDVITAQFPNFLGTSLESRQLTVAFAPRTDEARLQFKMSGNTYYLYLHSAARTLVREAIAKYNKDFDSTNLDGRMSQRKSERLYGDAKACYMEWGLGSFAMNGEASPRIAAGYRFEGKSPYFVITVYSAINPKYKSGDSNIEKSVKYAIYMNREQSIALADALDESALMAALDTVRVPVFAPDKYKEK